MENCLSLIFEKRGASFLSLAVRRQIPPGRFLAKTSVTGLWHDVGNDKVRKKTLQVLRDVSGRLRTKQWQGNANLSISQAVEI